MKTPRLMEKMEYMMFDNRNPSMILCSPELERALNMKAFHITEIRGFVLLQTTEVEDQTLNINEDQVNDPP